MPRSSTLALAPRLLAATQEPSRPSVPSPSISSETSPCLLPGFQSPNAQRAKDCETDQHLPLGRRIEWIVQIAELQPQPRESRRVVHAVIRGFFCVVLLHSFGVIPGTH